jgi:UDP-N-acetylmuramoyl-tripeptide--D-alanyl-D-alanine ligase
MDFFIPLFIQYQLYLLQLENYELGRYWKLLWVKGFFPKAKQLQRKELVWTAKARALMVMAAALHILIAVIISFIFTTQFVDAGLVATVFVAVLIVLLPFYFLLFTFSLTLIRPLDSYVKNKIIRKAKVKISGLKNLTVIGVAGSYGKTTMKQVIAQVLSVKRKVLSTPESVNTPVGISRFILGNVDDETQILILELGEHYPGDIKELCEIAPPDIAVVTGINEAHFERMGSLKIITKTIFESVQFAKPNALVLLNSDDKNITDAYSGYTQDHQTVKLYSESDILNPEFSEEKLGWKGIEKNIGEIFIPLLGKYILGDVAAAVTIAQKIGMKDVDIKIGLSRIKPVEHRLQPIPSAENVLVIDDSYNGNPDGVREAISVLGKFSGRRKIYITPGLVESGSETEAIHKKIGEQLSFVADIVILIKNSVTGFIELGIKNSGKLEVGSEREKKKPEIIWFETALEAHAALPKILKPGDVVMFQNDWGDQYI